MGWPSRVAGHIDDDEDSVTASEMIAFKRKACISGQVILDGMDILRLEMGGLLTFGNH